MATEQQTSFPDNVKIVEAKRNIRRSVVDAITMLIAMTLVLYLIWFQGQRLHRFVENEWQLGGWIVYVLAGLLIGLLGLGMWLYVYDKLRDMILVRQLGRRGTRGTAVVVGHEKDERYEDDLYYIFYQFSSDFVVKCEDETETKSWYNLPKGTQLTIVFLKQKPTVSKLLEKA